MQLSERAKQLIPKARIVSFADWKNRYPDRTIAIFQTADDEARYLTDEELNTIATLLPDTAVSSEQARLLHSKAPEIVQQARQQVLANFPGITEPGGGLYPPERAEACWRDFWHFLRCITYGIAGRSYQYTSPEGLEHMRLLYQELRVPLDAMVLGLENLKFYSLQHFEPEQGEALVPYFDHLINAMESFRENGN